MLIGYCGERSEREGAEQVAGWVREQGWDAVVAPISREFVHMDGLVVPVAPKLLVACVDAMEEWLVALLRGTMELRWRNSRSGRTRQPHVARAPRSSGNLNRSIGERCIRVSTRSVGRPSGCPWSGHAERQSGYVMA